MTDSIPAATGAESAPPPDVPGERRAVSSRAVLLVLLLSVFAAVATSAFIYRRFVTFSPLADRHLPTDTTVAARIHVEQAVVYEPFRKAFLGLFERGNRLPISRLEHLEKQTSIELGVDLREVVLGHDGAGHWVVIAGGHFRRDGVLEGLHRMFSAEGVQLSQGENPPHLGHASGITFGISEDGTLILASSLDMLRRAYLPRKAPVEFRSGAALSFVALPAMHECCPVEFVGGRVDVMPGSTFPFEIDLAVAEGSFDAAKARALLSGKTGDFMLVGDVKDMPRVELDRGHVRAFGTLDRQEFDRMIGRLALQLEGFLRH